MVHTNAGKPKEVGLLVLSQSSNIASTFVTLMQIVYGAYELSKGTGHAFKIYGYWAYTLMVVPYLMMSLVNLLGNLATPVYPSIYLVTIPTMEEAQRRGYVFNGHTGSICHDHFED
ncbi:hypothetical protein DE146DRAFT_465785 [Phaeosphaeria sp. MPI-PUGE-AT-0046c]|nr:hypothetical protein DE146DRAFT_465785 [Phaeosphaeria sp. MPI-PUGE-AT-0046c]